MADRSVREQDAELARGAEHAPRVATRSPNLGSIVARWQQSLGNQGVAQLAAMAGAGAGAAEGVAAGGGAEAAPATAESGAGAAGPGRHGNERATGDAAPGADTATDGGGPAGAPTNTTGATHGAENTGPGTNERAGTGVIEMEPMVVTGRAAHQNERATNGIIEMEPLEITGRAPHQNERATNGIIEMEPLEITGRAPHQNERATNGIIEMEPMIITATPPVAPHSTVPGRGHGVGRNEIRLDDAPGGPATNGHAPHAPAAGDGVIDLDQSAPPRHQNRVAMTGDATAIDIDQTAGDGRNHVSMRADNAAHGGNAPRAAAGGLTTPGFTERNAAQRGKAPGKGAKQAGGHRPGPGGGGGGGHRGGGGGHGGGRAAPKPSLGDPTLDRWKAAVNAGTDGVKPGDLGEAKNGAGEVAKHGKAATDKRKGAQPDPAVDAKAHQPPVPQEEPKQQKLDTSEADAAIVAVETAGQKRLSDQSFSAVGQPPAYTGATLAPSDYVPKTMTTKADDLAKQLAGKLDDESKRPALTEQLKKLKAQIATIEQNAGKAPAGDVPKAVHDEGPAKLTPPDPAMGDVLGDAIARALQTVTPKADGIVKGAVSAAHGDKVPKMLEMGTAEKGPLEQELRTELTGIATAAGVSKEQLDKKIGEQRDVVAKQADQANKDVHEAHTTAQTERQEQTKQEGEGIAGAKVAVQTEIEQKQAAASGPPDTKAIETKRDELLTKMEGTGAAALAGLHGSLTKRHAELDAAAGEKKQKIKSAADTQAAAIRRHWATDPDQNKGMVEARPTADWGIAEAAKVDAELRKLKAAAQTEHDGFAGGVNDKLGPGKEHIRDWAAHQEGRERSWWDRLLDMFRDWGKQAAANNDAWEKQRNAESRDAMTADLTALTKIREAQLSGNNEAVEAEFARLGKEQQQLAQQFFAGKIDSIGFVAESTMARIGGRRTPELAKTFEERAIAEWDWESLGQLARATNPGFQPKVLANKVHGGVDGWGTNEAKVYEGLGGARTAVERAALDKCYTATFGASMAEDVRDDMSSEELDRAEALMSGDTALADAATIAEAVDGLGTDEKAIRDALRGKTPEELEAIKKAYRDKYGKELTADLRDDMGGAELDNALALADGDTDKADAAELEDAMSGPGTDEDKMKQVYERIREEENKYALAHGLTKAELDKRIRDRNGRVAKKYADQGYGDLNKNAKDELSDGDSLSENNADNKLFTALQEGDESKIDAAKALVEKDGVYTSDDEVEKIVRNQRKKAEFDVNLDEAGQKARLLALAQSGDIAPDEYKAKMAELDPKDPAVKERREARIQAKGKENMAALKSSYEGMANTDVSIALDGKQTFDDLVDNGTSGYSKDEIKELMASGGKLSDDQEMYYATAGVGTDEDKIKETLKDKTPAEVQKIREAYEKNHGKGSFDSDILGDLSGREDLDVGLQLKYGDPSTFARQLDEAKDPAQRAELMKNFQAYLEKRRDFEKSGDIGAAMDLFGDGMNSADQLSDAIDRAKKYDQALTEAEKKPGYDPKKKDEDPNLVAAAANFDMNFQGAVQAQEEVREKIDAITDVAAQIGGAVAGIAVTILTAGTAGPAVLALYAAAASAAASIALKMSLKGAAYGWEDLGIDLAVGVVDGAMSYATAGLGKAVVASLERAVASQALKVAAEEGVEKVSESAVKAFLKEALEEGIQNGIQAMPSAFVGGVLNGQDPLAAAQGAGMAGLQGAGMGMGIHSVKTAGGAALKGIKGALSEEPHIETKGPGGGHVDEPHTTASTPEPEPELKSAPDTPPPEVDLPPAADPKAVVEAAEQGKLPEGASNHVDEGQLKKGATPEPHENMPEPSGPHDPAAVRSAEPVDPANGRYPEREPAVAEGKNGPHPDDVGKHLSEDDLARRYGMPDENVQKIKAICAEEGVIVDIRPTTPYAEPMLREGTALPKPEAVKAKTINELDVMLGLAPKENLGKVGYFPPEKIRLPENFDQLEPKLQDELLARAKQRQAEFHDYQGDMAKLVDEGKIRLENDGTITNQSLLPGEDALPFTGDHDIYDIRDSEGRPLSPEKYKEVVGKLMAADAGIMHGAANNWAIDSPGTFNEKAMGKMEANHSAGGKEPLVRIGAGEPHATWHEPYEVPEGTIFFSEGEAAKDLASNMDHFKQVVAGDPHAEYALMRNVETGEYLVMQGSAKEVPVFEAEGMVAAPANQTVGGPIQELTAGGKWVVEAHSHPIDPELGHVPEYNRLPSGAKGDMGRMVDEAYRTGQARTSELHYTTPDGPGVTKFGFDPDPANGKPYFVELTTPEGPVRREFATIEEYHGWYASEHGKVANLGEVPDSFTGPRFTAPDPAPHLPEPTASTDFDAEEPTNPGRKVEPEPTTVRGVEREPFGGTLSEQVDEEFQSHQDRSHGDLQAERIASLTPPQVPSDPLALPEVREALTDTDALFDRLPPPANGKTVACSLGGEPVESGWADRGPYTGKEEVNARVAQAGVDAGHDTTGHPFDRERPGQYENSHAERQAAQHRPGDPIAVDRDMCPDCQRWFRDFARSEGVAQLVRDPSAVRLFLPDGSVRVLR